MRRISQKRHLTVLREDHIGDALGAIFLDQSPDHAATNLQLLQEYVGPRVRITRLELGVDRADLNVEIQAFSDEATRLAAAAEDLHTKGAPRNALELFRQALDLDPLNAHAARGAGLLFFRQGRYHEALEMLRRARETGPEHADVMYTLGQVALKLDRVATATAYLERAFELSPSHFGARRALAELGRRPKPPPRQRPVAEHKPPPAVERNRQ